MCRQLGIITTQNDSSITAPALRVFKRIITDGRIPDGQPAGHHDGWGTALMRETAAQHYRSTQSGATDPVYDELIELAGQQSRGSLLVHARKASVGSKLIANTHPFVSGGLAFSHNGTILEYAKIHLAAPFNQLEGTTDSEKFFALIRQEYRSFSRGQLAEAVQSAARRIMYRNIDFTALNIILIADGLLIASRIVNEKNSFVKNTNAMDSYYTLFYARHTETESHLACSEILPELNLDWRIIENNRIIEITNAGHLRELIV